MGVQIALSTIVYSLIFLIPGLLFRRFYFSGQFTKQFHQGNLFERFLWVLFSGTSVLIASSLLLYFLRKVFEIELVAALSYEKTAKILNYLNQNTLPKWKYIEPVYLEFFVLLGYIYLMSCILGFLKYIIVTELRIDKFFSALKFQNYWNYIIRGSLHKNRTAQIGSRKIRTYADILEGEEMENTMYSGIVRDYFIDAKTNKLESVILEEAYIGHGEERQPIPGDFFVVHGNRIKNISFHFSRIELYKGNKKKLPLNILKVSFAFYVTLLAISLSVYYESDFLKASWFRRVYFFIFSTLSFFPIVLLCNKFFRFSLQRPHSIKSILTLMLFTLLPIAMLFFKLPWWKLLLSVVGIFLATAILLTFTKNSESKKE